MEIMVTCNNINGNDNDNNNNNVINDNHSTCNNATNNIKDTLKNTSPVHFIIRNYCIVTLIYLKTPCGYCSVARCPPRLRALI